MPLSLSSGINQMLFGFLMQPDGMYLSHCVLSSDGNCKIYSTCDCTSLKCVFLHLTKKSERSIICLQRYKLKTILVSYPYTFIFTTKPDTHHGILMYRRVWKHTSAVYIVHKSKLARSPLLHTAVESFCTLRRPMFFILQGEEKGCGLCWPRSDQKWCIAGATCREL